MIFLNCSFEKALNMFLDWMILFCLHFRYFQFACFIHLDVINLPWTLCSLSSSLTVGCHCFQSLKCSVNSRRVFKGFNACVHVCEKVTLKKQTIPRCLSSSCLYLCNNCLWSYLFFLAYFNFLNLGFYR